MKKTKLKKALIFLPMILLIFSIEYQFLGVKIETSNYKCIGNTIDLGSYTASYYEKGSGEYTFVFITGSGTPCAYTDFYYLQEELSNYGQTISFDHSGYGWSSKSDKERTIDNLTKELETLIECVSINDKIILICHSLGSLEAISYAQNNKDKVKGIIFLDSGSPEFYSEDSELSAKLINQGTSFVNSIGLNRICGTFNVLLPFYGENIRYKNLPDELKKIDKVKYYELAGTFYTRYYTNKMNENAKTVLEKEKLNDLPILVLSSDSGNSWNEVQNQLAEWSNNSEHYTIKNSSHYIHWSNYEEVQKYINSFVEKITK